MTIHLAGYRTVFPNIVYTRKENHALPAGAEFQGTRVLLFHRYTEATGDEVILYLQAKERELPVEVPSTAVLQTLSYVERAILGLPAEERENLRSGNPELMAFLKKNTFAKALGVGETPTQYLSLFKGLIPTEMIELNERLGNIHDSGWYKKALQHDDLKQAGMGEQWQMRVVYTSEGLPPRSDIDFLMKHGAYRSRTIWISSNLRPSVYHDIVDTLYAGFPTPDEIALLEDTSARVLENEATQPIKALLSHLQMQSIRAMLQSAGDPVIVLDGGKFQPDASSKDDDPRDSKKWN